MRIIVVAIHGMLTGQTSPSWPDDFDGWLYHRDPSIKFLKKEYRALPLPRWNNWIKDPHIARGLANEIFQFLDRVPALAPSPAIWFVCHSNGAVIALKTIRRLIDNGYKVDGVIMTGAAIHADVARNGILDWFNLHCLNNAISYSSVDDRVVSGDGRAAATRLRRIRDWCWGKIMWPYGSLGRTGWLLNRAPYARAESSGQRRIITRWYPGGHSTYFTPANRPTTFEQIYADISTSVRF